MDTVIYERQKSLGIYPPNAVSIVGCGGVGAWVAADLAMAGVERFTLFDDDTLKMHNINRVPFGPKDVGKPKTLVLKNFIKRIRANTRIYSVGKFSDITKRLLDSVVVDCTDKLRVQRALYKECKARGWCYYRVGYDGHHITIIDGQHTNAPKVEKVWEDGSGQEGYTIVASWVVPPQIAAALVTDAICRECLNHGRINGRPPLTTDIEKLWYTR